MHPLPIIDDVLPELDKAKVFSKFDLSNGFWHCKLDHESSMLTTFQTPFGRYRWLRLPFGLSISSEIFQKRLQSSLEGIEFIICIADDILVFGSGNNYKDAKANHDTNLTKLMERCRKFGIRLNKDKAELLRDEINFLGHVITSNGLKADPDKIKAIVELKAPSNVNEVQCFNGMINYLSKFLPKLSDVMQPIRKLMRKDVEWKWGKEQKRSFSEIKSLITKTPVLAFYDQSK